MGPFQISKKMIGGLSDELLRSLLDQLLTAEARARNISTAGIFVGGNQTAPDGGVDGSIVWKGRPVPRNWLPRRDTRFQCKAEGMTPVKLREEIRPGDIPRPLFEDLAKTRGAYVVFTTDDPSQSWLTKRLASMRAAIDDVPNQSRIHLDFYGADKIARWVNEHPGVAVWLLEKLERPVGGWRPHGTWSAQDSLGQQYLFDSTARAQVEGVHVAMDEALSSMRAALAEPGGVVRLVGLSGMGKTRLAEALFDARIDPATALQPARAIYGDAGLDLGVSPPLLAEQLAMNAVDAVLVVDNCNQRTHTQLAEIIKRGISQTSLITIDYDVGGEQPVGQLVRLEANSEEILQSVLKQRFPNLTDGERSHLAKFSGGNARIALKLAEAGGEGVDLSKLNDSELLDRLFQSGRQVIHPDARVCAEVASLVYAFYVENGDEHDPEHATLAELAEVSEQTFYRNVATFLEWGVVQQRGPQRAVMPQPLANMLAAPFVRRSDPNALISKFLAAPQRLLASFSRRLGQLHDEPAAVRIMARLFDASGPFGNPASLNDILRRGFVKGAPASPDAALAAIERTLAGPDRAALVNPLNEGRMDYVQLLVLIAHDASLFARAVEALIQFALADDDETRDDQRARDHLLERFWPVLSFTLANQEERLEIIDRMLADPDERLVGLAVEALDHMLDAGHFSSSLNLEFGARSRLTEWRPYNGAGYAPWFKAAYDRIVCIAQGGGPSANRARTIVAEHFREHVAQFEDLALSAMSRVRGNGFWEKGWRSVNDALHFARLKAESGELAKVISLERELRPRSLEDFFEAFVLGEPWRHWHPSARRRALIRNAGLLARATARCVLRSGEDPLPYLRRAMRSDVPNSVEQFAVGLARNSSDLNALWSEAYAIYKEARTGRSRPAILAGILSGAFRKDRDWVDARLNELVADPVAADHLVSLETSVPLNEAAVARFRLALTNGTIPPERFSLLMLGKVTKPIPGPALAGLLRQLHSLEDGVQPALEVLHMRMFGDLADKVKIDASLIQLGRDFLADRRTYSEKVGRDDHCLTEIAQVVFQGEGGEEVARAACRALLESERSNRHSYLEFDELCAQMMKRYPRIVLEEIVEKSNNDYLVGRFFGGWARNSEDFDAAKFGLDRQILIDWVREDPSNRATKLANFVPYAVTNPETNQLAWSPLALELIALAPDPFPVLRMFEQRFFTGAGWGPISLRFVRRKPLVSALADHSDSRIRSWAAAARKGLEANITRWDEADSDQNSRFE